MTVRSREPWEDGVGELDRKGPRDGNSWGVGTGLIAVYDSEELWEDSVGSLT